MHSMYEVIMATGCISTSLVHNHSSHKGKVCLVQLIRRHICIPHQLVGSGHETRYMHVRRAFHLLYYSHYQSSFSGQRCVCVDSNCSI